MKREELLKIAKPILFNTQMVRAILEGRKTCTRRLIKPQPTRKKCWGIVVDTTGSSKEIGTVWWADKDIEYDFNIGCKEVDRRKPQYKVGDVLYIRETWSEWTDGYLYRAWTGPFPQPGKASVMTWHPSIHMPKEAARIFLRVTGVRAERLQDITMEQVFNEGIKSHIVLQGQLGIEYKDVDGEKKVTQDGLELAMCDFAILWNSTIDKKEQEVYGWDANPWVWVYEFERIEAE